MFVLRPSSPFRAPQPKPVEAQPIRVQAKAVTKKRRAKAQAELDKERAKKAAIDIDAPEVSASEPFIDEGLPIPESYSTDILRAMLQDPFRIFIYWEIRDESLKGLTQYFSAEEAARFAVVLKLFEVEGRNEAFFEVERKGRYWMMVFPDREYEFEIGVRSPEHGYIKLIGSNRVRAPRGTVAPVPAPEVEYKLTPAEFTDIIDASGFAAEQTLNVTLAAAAGDAPDQAALQSAWQRLPEPVREAVPVVASGGALTREMIAELPEPLRSELMTLFTGSDGNIAGIGLMHYLPELLREALDDEREWVDDRLHPLHLTPKFFVGASDSVSWPTEKMRWPGLPVLPTSPGQPRWMKGKWDDSVKGGLGKRADGDLFICWPQASPVTCQPETRNVGKRISRHRTPRALAVRAPPGVSRISRRRVAI